MSEIFVSYASADQAVADRLVRGIERHGLSCWIASRDIRPGADYQSSIAAAIEASTAVIVLYSRQALASCEIPKEMSLASRKPLIPLRIENIAPAGAFRYQLANAQYVDLFADFEGKLAELCLHLDEACKKSGETARKVRVAMRWRKTRSWAVRAGLAVNALLAANLAWRSAPALHAAFDRAPSAPAPTTELAAAAVAQRSDAVQPSVPAIPSPAAFVLPPAPPADAESAARGFARQYYAAMTGSAERALTFLTADTVDPLRFYGQMLSRSRLLDIQRSYFVRWPERHMSVRADSLSASCSGNGLVCTVSGITDYAMKSVVRNAASSGSEHFTLQLAAAGAGWKIAAIDSTPLARRNIALSASPSDAPMPPTDRQN
jgi:hypothetical protein